MKNRRSEIEIISKILDVTNGGAKKTEILYQGNLSYRQLQDYLTYLIDKNIIEEEYIKDNGNSHKLYKTTEKGFNVLIDINRLLLKLG